MKIPRKELLEELENIEDSEPVKSVVKKEVKEIIEAIWIDDKISCDVLFKRIHYWQKSGISYYSIDKLLSILVKYNFFSFEMNGNFEILKCHAVGITPTSMAPSLPNFHDEVIKDKRKLYFTDHEKAIEYAEAVKKNEQWEDIVLVKFEKV
jgi:hypothetical protein